MSEETIAVELPEPAFRKPQRPAELTYCAVDETLVSTILTTSICRRTLSATALPSLISASLVLPPLLIEGIEQRALSQPEGQGRPTPCGNG